MGLPCHAQVACCGLPHRPAVSCMHHAATSGSSRCRAVVTRATSTATSGSWHAAHHAYERVLRYPDGNVRYIRYPVAEQTFDEDDEDFMDVPGLWKWPDHSGRPVTAGRPDMGQQLQKAQKQRQVWLHSFQAMTWEPAVDSSRPHSWLTTAPWCVPAGIQRSSSLHGPSSA
jgi:hypothetical protein